MYSQYENHPWKTKKRIENKHKINGFFAYGIVVSFISFISTFTYIKGVVHYVHHEFHQQSQVIKNYLEIIRCFEIGEYLKVVGYSIIMVLKEENISFIALF